jgi:sec-independent protein translocase protein TatA
VGSGIISPWHIAIFVLVVLLLYGPKKLPEMGRSLGHGIREFKNSATHEEQPGDDPSPTSRPLPLEPPDRDAI